MKGNNCSKLRTREPLPDGKSTKKNRIYDHCDWLEISVDQNFKHQVDVRQSSNYLTFRSLR